MSSAVRQFCVAAMLAVGLCGPALADRFEDDLVQQLRAQGFYQVEVSHTLLGRIRVVATSATLWREIVVNPRTGEILRDYSEELASDDVTAPKLLNSGTGSNSSGSNSGSGSSGSNSGSGSSGSGSGSGSSGSGSSGSGSGSSGSGGGSSGSGSGSGGSGSSGSGSSGSGSGGSGSGGSGSSGSGGSDDDG